MGALTSYHDLAQSGLLARELPLLAEAAGQVGDPQVRHRGTIGGSLAHADPAADLPAVVLALDATLVARGPSGTREIGAGEFFRDLFESALQPGELLTEIRIPKPQAAGWSFQKFTKRAIDWAIVGVAVQGGRVALVNMGPAARCGPAAVERALAGRGGAARRRRSRGRGHEPARRPARGRPRTGSTWPASWSAGPWKRPAHVRAADNPDPRSWWPNVRDPAESGIQCSRSMMPRMFLPSSRSW